MLKLENDALRDDVAAGRRRLYIKAVCQSVREATTPPAWIMQPPDWQTPLNGIISPSERGLITMQKQLEGTRSILMSASVDRVAYIDGHHGNYCGAIHIALPAEYKCLK